MRITDYDLEMCYSVQTNSFSSCRNFLTAENKSSSNRVLIVQSDFDEASLSANLIASAK